MNRDDKIKAYLDGKFLGQDALDRLALESRISRFERFTDKTTKFWKGSRPIVLWDDWVEDAAIGVLIIVVCAALSLFGDQKFGCSFTIDSRPSSEAPR